MPIITLKNSNLEHDHDIYSMNLQPDQNLNQTETQIQNQP